MSKSLLDLMVDDHREGRATAKVEGDLAERLERERAQASQRAWEAEKQEAAEQSPGLQELGGLREGMLFEMLKAEPAINGRYRVVRLDLKATHDRQLVAQKLPEGGYLVLKERKLIDLIHFGLLRVL